MSSNLENLKLVAEVLKEIKEEIVFVGGATVALYIDDVAAPEPQPSEDIDCVVEIATYMEWTKFENVLRKKGFKDVDLTGEDRQPPTCRKYLMGMKIDFMPINEAVLGYGNPWFKQGTSNSIVVKLDDVEIKIFSLEYFVAAKLKAFNDRGIQGDIRFSQDLEDITELLDGCTYFEETILGAVEEVKSFIIHEFAKFLENDEYREAMYGFIGYGAARTNELRLERAYGIIERLCALED